MLRNPSSFRDPSGFIFSYEEKVYRSIAPEFSPIFNDYSQSALYSKLTERGWLLKHKSIDGDLTDGIPGTGSTIIEPEQLQVVSYPFEWSFSQFKESAILTLDICLEALNHGFILKDASAFNVQLFKGHSSFIDSLSFVKYDEGQSRTAYKQFICHFLNPLLLMAKVDPCLNNLLRVYLDGIPSRLTSQILPLLSWLHPVVFMNVRMAAFFEKRYERKGVLPKNRIPLNSLRNMLQVLRSYIHALELRMTDTEWGSYYSETNYNLRAFESKSKLVLDLLNSIGPSFRRLLDLGSNDGTFSRKIAHLADTVISADIDPAAVDANFLKNREQGIRNVYPLRVDFTNPSPNIGWNCEERESFFKRAQSDVVICLAFIHHMVIGQNVPFEMVASALASLSENLIIEFVDENDSQVTKLLSTRLPTHSYDQVKFEMAFRTFFTIEHKVDIPETRRTLYRMKRLNVIPHMLESLRQ